MSANGFTLDSWPIVHMTRTLYSWVSQLQWYAPLHPLHVLPFSTRKGHAHISVGAAGMLLNEGDNTAEPPITWTNVGIAAIMLGFNVGISAWLGLGISFGLAIAAIRCVVQLTLLSLLLSQIFLTQNPFYIFGMTLCLGILAAFEVTYWRSKRRFPGMFGSTLATVMVSTLTVALFCNAYALNMSPAYTATKFIPTIGMLFGSCIIGMSIGMAAVMESLDAHRDRTEAMLCYGASRWEAIKPVVVQAVRAAMLPNITNMGITGLISIPGMMTGWVLGGANVLQASRYQQIVLFMISASTASSTLLSVLFCASVLVDSSPRLRLDLLVAADSKEKQAQNISGVSKASSRLSLRHRGCRSKSELYLSGTPRNRYTATPSLLNIDSRNQELLGSIAMSAVDSRLLAIAASADRSSTGTDNDEPTQRTSLLMQSHPSCQSSTVLDTENEPLNTCRHRYTKLTERLPQPRSLAHHSGMWEDWSMLCGLHNQPVGSLSRHFSYTQDPTGILLHQPQELNLSLIYESLESREDSNRAK